YRVQAHKVGSRVIVFSRNGHDFTERFPSIAQLLHELPAKAAVLDGEVVASDADGRPNFARLHVRWRWPGTIQLRAFDFLALNGQDWRPRPLVKRQSRLQALLERFGCPDPKPSKMAWRCCAWPNNRDLRGLSANAAMPLIALASAGTGTRSRRWPGAR